MSTRNAPRTRRGPRPTLAAIAVLLVLGAVLVPDLDRIASASAALVGGATATLVVAVWGLAAVRARRTRALRGAGP